MSIKEREINRTSVGQMFSRSFGVEIEAIGPVGTSMAATSEAIRAVGVPCLAAGYSHTVSSYWRIVSDGSLNTDHFPGGNPMEIVSPPLRGEGGLEQLKKVCDVLTALGHKVNKSCGLHVHVEARSLSLASLRKLASNYARYEKVLDSLVPESRRGNNNRYCQSVANLNLTALVTAASIADIARIVNNSDRYRKLNFVAFWRHGTVEFRQHSGTVDGRKAVAWTRLCLRLVALAHNNPTMPVFGVAAPPSRTRRIRPNSKLALIAALLQRPEGCTAADILAATGWPTVSAQQQAAAAGLVLRVERRGRICHYYGTPPSVAPSVQQTAPPTPKPTFETMMTDLAVPVDEVKYWSARQIELSVRPTVAATAA